MNSVLTKVSCSIFSSVTSLQIQFVPVRYRYYADKIARGPYSKKFGYKDKIFREGVLPRLKDAGPVPGPIYLPGNAWAPEKVRHGQNDYIDILGGGKLRPPDIAYTVPKWLRGKKGNELQLLLLKQKVFSKTPYQYEDPDRWKSISRRVKYLYNYLNRKTKTGFSEDQ